MKWLLVFGIVAIAATTAGLRWNRIRQTPMSPLSVRRLSPAEGVLRGKPHEAVLVELELVNSTQQPIELVPPSMSCSCQIATLPEKLIPAGGTSKMAISLRYPTSRTNTIPVVFKSPKGEVLGQTEVNLEADIELPDFMRFPDTVEIPIVDGVSDHQWKTSALALEVASTSNYVTGIRVTEGAEFVSAAIETSEKGDKSDVDCQRTYQLTFEILAPGHRDSTSALSTSTLTLPSAFKTCVIRKVFVSPGEIPSTPIFWPPKSTIGASAETSTVC